MGIMPIDIEGYAVLEDDGTWTAESTLTFPDGESMSKTTTGILTETEASKILLGLMAEAEQAVLAIGGHHIDKTQLN